MGGWCLIVGQLVQPLPREAENPRVHSSGYVYISCTPFNNRGGLTSVHLIGQSGVREIHRSFLTRPSPPGVSLLLVWTCSDGSKTLS